MYAQKKHSEEKKNQENQNEKNILLLKIYYFC